MNNFINVLNQKKTLFGLIVVAIIYEIFYGFGLGGLVVDIVVWLIGIGYIIVPILHAIYNIIKPDNKIRIELAARINLSIIIGVISGVLFGGFLNLGLMILGTDIK